MSGDLRVMSAHLRDLAAKQRQSAAEIWSATETAVSVDTSVRTTHGVIAWSTAAAVEAIQHARHGAGKGTERVSDGMAIDLHDAAAAYDRCDVGAKDALDCQVHAR